MIQIKMNQKMNSGKEAKKRKKRKNQNVTLIEMMKIQLA